MFKKKIDLMTFLLPVVSIILLSLLQKVSSDGTIQVKLLNYTNPGGKLATGACCDGIGDFCEPGGGCDTLFYVGIDEVSNPARDNYKAFKYGYVTTDKAMDQANIDFRRKTNQDLGIVNPINYNFASSWPGQVMMKVQVWDWDIGDDEKIEFLQSALTLSAASLNQNNAPWTSARLRTRTTLYVDVRVLCGTNLYGDQCNARCLPGGSKYTCGADGSKICKSGWTGSDCNTAAAGAGQVTVPALDCGGGCQNNGLCNGGSCSCRSGFTGGNCETNIDECAGVDCHGGTCIDGINQYTCQCPIGYTGGNCETNIDECAGADCHGGTCIDGINQYTCQCPIGYTGGYCETDINECVGVDCNRGTCLDGINEYTCQCPIGYTGRNCESNIDNCAGVECNGGTCVDLTNRFTCQCPIGFTGNTCEEAEEGCQINPCRNGGTCQVIDHVVYCTCATGWTGSRCNADIDECSTNMCRNSIRCLNTDSAFVCICQFGWAGPLCDAKINAVTSRISKRSVWTFRGKLSDAEIVYILNLVITRITATGSTYSVIVYYEIRFHNSESPREAKTIVFLRVSSGGEPIPVETLTAFANGPSKSKISSSLISAEDDNGDSTARNLMLSTSRTSKGSVWTLRGTLSDDEILLILNRVITVVTGADYGGSQSTSSVLVYYEVRFLNSESPQEAKTILLLRVNSGGNPIPMGTLTALANGPSKSNFSSSLMSAEDDDGDNTATDLTLSTARISKISVWTFQGKLSDDDILRILNRVITRVTVAGSGGSQSTSSVIVYYEVRFLNSESPREAQTTLLLRVNNGGEPIPMETLTALANGASKFEISSSLMSAEDDNGDNTAKDPMLSTSRISKRSAWTFGGKLSDNEILGILNRVITTVTSIGSGGSQSTKSVLVDYEVRYVNSESPREAMTILLLRLNSGGEPVPIETLTALANGPSKSLLSSSLMSAKDDNGDSDLILGTSQISKSSVWAFRGILSDDDILLILNRVITRVTATGSGGSQSTSIVLVFYEVRYLNSESPRDAKTILLLRVNSGGNPIPMETLTALANGPSKFEISSSLLSAEDDNGVNTAALLGTGTQGQTQLHLELSELERRLDIGAIIVICVVIIGLIIGIVLVCIRKPRQKWEFETQQTGPVEMPAEFQGQSLEEGECGGLGTGEQDNYTTDGSGHQPPASNTYVIKGHGHDQKGSNIGSSSSSSSSSSSKTSSYVNVPADVKRKK